MSLQPDKPLLEALRFALGNLEADPAPDTVNRAELKRILRERIAELEAVSRIRKHE